MNQDKLDLLAILARELFFIERSVNDRTEWRLVIYERDAFLDAIQKYGPLVISQAKWYAIGKAVREYETYIYDGSNSTCAMCVKYLTEVGGDNDILSSCMRCPVAQATGIGGCFGTPYEAYCHSDDDDIDGLTKAAWDEILFLDGLHV